MLDRLTTVLAVVSVVGCGLVAGLMFAFSVSVMTALGRLPAAQGIAAMREINVAILNPAFALVFGGTTLSCLVLAAIAAFTLDRPGARWCLAGTLLFLIGVVVVTAVVNVPMNDALAAVDPAGETCAELWARYLTQWSAWNHMRTLTACGATALLALALLRR